MLTLGIRCTCIIQRPIQSWFEAVLAVLQSWDQTWHAFRCPKGVQKGQNDFKWCFLSFGTIFGPFGILRIISEKKLDIVPQKHKVLLGLSAPWPKWFGEKNQVLSEMVLKFPNGPKMFPNGQKHVMLIIWYNFFIPLWDNGKHAVFGHFVPFWAHLDFWDHFRLNLIFCPKSLWPRSTLCFWGKKSSFVWNDPKKSNWAQNGTKWSKTCYIDHFGSFWTLLDLFGTSASLPCLAIFGPKRAILDPPAHMIEGCQCPKLLQTNFVYVLGLCICDGFPK